MNATSSSATTDVSRVPVVIFAGGRGARFDHESQVTPKPMITVAGKPILRHIIDSLAAQGFREFIVATGYLGERVSAHFLATSERTVRADYHDLFRAQLGTGDSAASYWVTVVDTGVEAHTGLRLSRVSPYIGDRDFVLTYGDGLSDVRMSDVIAVHRASPDWWPDHPARRRPLVTLTAVNPPARFGSVVVNGAFSTHVRRFEEKGSQEWISGGFMFCAPGLLDRVYGGAELETEVLPSLAEEWTLRCHRHHGYWRCMDTRRDLEQIESDVAAHGGRLPWLIPTPESDTVKP